MKKIYLKELQSRLLGTVTDNDDALDHFSTDGSIFTLRPQLVVYPKNTADVRKTMVFLNERSKAGQKIGLTARGYSYGQ